MDSLFEHWSEAAREAAVRARAAARNQFERMRPGDDHNLGHGHFIKRDEDGSFSHFHAGNHEAEGFDIPALMRHLDEFRGAFSTGPQLDLDAPRLPLDLSAPRQPLDLGAPRRSLTEAWSPAARAAAALARRKGGGGSFRPTPEVRKFASSLATASPFGASQNALAAKAGRGDTLTDQETKRIHLLSRHSSHPLARAVQDHTLAHFGSLRAMDAA